jgi:biotin carboxyl carrier protein
MKYLVKIHDKLIEVEIDNVHKQPINARVNGKTYEVWVSEDTSISEIKVDTIKKEKASATSDAIRTKITNVPSNGSQQNHKKTVNSPIPGTVISIDVKPGDQVVTGQPLCVIEAMKMKNTIRSPKDGVVHFVPIQIGQHVRHNEVLVEFVE